jgi:hypothetical protein
MNTMPLPVQAARLGDDSGVWVGPAGTQDPKQTREQRRSKPPYACSMPIASETSLAWLQL